MNSDKREDYYVGLDMGTGSLGGAVTDTQYHLLKVKGKDFWFVPVQMESFQTRYTEKN